MNIRGVGKSHKIVKQTDSGFGVDAQAGLEGPSSPDSPCLSGLSCMTLSWVGTPMLAPSSKQCLEAAMVVDNCLERSIKLLFTNEEWENFKFGDQNLCI